MVELQGQGGGFYWRFFGGLISAFLANSPFIITARASDLSGIFGMFGFYLIMFYLTVFAVYILFSLSPLLYTLEIIIKYILYRLSK